MSKFTVVFDACVLYPAPLRDLLMRLTLTDLFKAHWTDQIHEEWINALLRQNKYTREKLERVKNLMDSHVKDAKVTEFEPLISALELPDLNDRHVLAAAIKCGADAIVTFNLKDFPAKALEPYGIDVLHPDDFVHYQLDLSPPLCCQTIRNQRLALKNPEISAEELLSVLQKQQLPKTVSQLREYLGFI